MNQTLNRTLLILLALLALPALACSTADLPVVGQPTVEPTPTLPGDTLTLTVPIYTYNLQEGETIPGTQLTYVGPNGDAFDVLIDGLPAVKRIGDSFIWSGIVGPGVFANYNLRLTTNVLGGLPVAGPVVLVVLSPTPVETGSLPTDPPRLRFGEIGVNYLVPVGREVPGTTLTYQGLSQPNEGGSSLGLLTGGQGYPYLATGDSLVWTGRLRDNVYIRYNLRAASVTAENLRLLGTAELWITN